MPSDLSKAHAGAVVILAALMFTFHQWPGSLVVKILSGVFILAFIVRLLAHAYEFGINRKVFGSEDRKIFLPDLELRKAVALFRGFSEAGEDMTLPR